ncbi:MAG TPA: hypothetical protein VMF64_03360 [Steroidobacteraceae bacterium]|nr:hypothetical protein [Steroidobacteraceae bacterium]
MNVVRAIVLLIALAQMAVGGRFVLEGLRTAGFYLLGMGSVILAAIFFERWRYRASSTQAPTGWQRTDERFEDPHSGEILTVYYDPASGERHYVSEGRATPPRRDSNHNHGHGPI